MRTLGRLTAGVIAAVLLTGCATLMPGPEPQQAPWAVDPSADLGPETTEVSLLVNEVACASGRSAEGRISADVDYRGDEIVITAYVRPLDGGQDCPGNPNTPYLLELDEPLGDRTLVNGATDELARRPLEGVDG